MSKWFALAGVLFLILLLGFAWWDGYSTRGLKEEIEDAKAEQRQRDEQREIQNAVNKLDDTGLRNAINRVQ